MRLTAARTRMNRYLTDHGGRATITRKQGATWVPVATDVPVMLQPQAGVGSGIDPFTATSDSGASSRLSFPFGTDIQRGYRVDVTTPQGTAPGTITIAALLDTSLAISTDAIGSTEETAVETYPVTIERWDADTEAFVAILTVDAQAVTTHVGQLSRDDQGARGATRSGTLIITPVPSVALATGDYILGIPWAVGAQITSVRPQVGDRGEYDFRYTSGSV